MVVVRCEGILISGNFYRNKLKFLDYLKKRTRTNPGRGPFHYRYLILGCKMFLAKLICNLDLDFQNWSLGAFGHS